MTDSALPRYAEVSSELDRLELGIEASELHGSLCGFLCAGGTSTRGEWLNRLALDAAEGATVPEGGFLERLYTASIDQLGDPDFGFELLLPPEGVEVGERADALLAWCRGFLGGFGLASGPKPPLSAEADEALTDLGRIAASQLSYEDPEADEAALEEVAEFVRVAALLLHSDCVLAPRHRRSLN